ncbi:MAG: hypothetical protein E6J17_04295 [Chloroflexi bacterium]|nr:MAG: hypothetical protein E6J17_04295 [Chloroflexota bacterium]
MPDISLPEVHLPDFKLPEGLRDMNREDIQKAMPDVRLPKIDLPKRSEISKELAKASREVDKALPRRSAPSPLPFVFFGMLAGLFIGWFLASSTVTGPRIGGAVDEVRGRVAKWRASDAGEEDDYDSQPAAFPDALRSPVGAEPYASNMNERETGVGVGPGTLPERVGASQGISSERF